MADLIIVFDLFNALISYSEIAFLAEEHFETINL